MEWISVKDQLPEIDQLVLWYHDTGGYSVFEIDKDLFWMDSLYSYLANYFHVTHWIKLPEPPKN